VEARLTSYQLSTDFTSVEARLTSYQLSTDFTSVEAGSVAATGVPSSLPAR